MPLEMALSMPDGVASLRIFILVSACMASSHGRADYLQVDCFGPKKAKNYIVYAHGWDSPNIGSHERLNRGLWQKWGQRHQWRIAAARGNGRCHQGRKQCWQLLTKKQIMASWQRVEQAAQTCFGAKVPFGVLGFSNGGDFVIGARGHCLTPLAQWYIAVGAGGIRSLQPQKMQSCGPLVMMIGKKDGGTWRRTHAFYDRMRGFLPQMQLKVFPEGHVLPEAMIIETIKELTTSGQASPQKP